MQRFLSHCAGSPQSQLGMTVQDCWQALVSLQEKHWERPDMLANVPGLQQPHEDWPMKGLKVPGAHGEHKRDKPMMEWDPAGHTVNMSTVLTTPKLPPVQCISN